MLLFIWANSLLGPKACSRALRHFRGPACNSRPTACSMQRARALPRAQAATWAWAGKAEPRLGHKTSPSTRGRSIQSDGPPLISRKQNRAPADSL
jgi:hypothetical protein